MFANFNMARHCFNHVSCGVYPEGMFAAFAFKAAAVGLQMLRACLQKERGCVEDQPQHAANSSTPKKPGLLRLVEDDTAALRDFQTGC